jgi:hypothetical protein
VRYWSFCLSVAGRGAGAALAMLAVAMAGCSQGVYVAPSGTPTPAPSSASTTSALVSGQPIAIPQIGGPQRDRDVHSIERSLSLGRDGRADVFANGPRRSTGAAKPISL